MGPTIKVQVAGKVREYPQDVAGYGNHLADRGETLSLSEAQRQAKEFFRINRNADQADAIKSLTFWVVLDSSGLAYHVSVSRTGHHEILAASPMPGPNNVQDLYVA